VERDERFKRLLEDEHFEPTSFLHELYKTSTVRDIEQFKHKLQNLQTEIIQTQMRINVCGEQALLNSHSVLQMSEDIMRTHDIFRGQRRTIERVTQLIGQIEGDVLAHID